MPGDWGRLLRVAEDRWNQETHAHRHAVRRAFCLRRAVVEVEGYGRQPYLFMRHHHDGSERTAQTDP